MLHMIRTQWQHRGEDGWSLTQLLMALAISGIGVGAAFAMLTIGHRHVQRGDAVTGLQQESRTSIEWLTRELRESAADSIVVAGDGNIGIAFASARNTSGEFQQDGHGQPQWQQVIVYYLKPETTHLYRYTVPKADWSQNFDPTNVIEETLGERISTDVSAISFSLNGLLLSVALETMQETQSGATTKNSLATNIVIRNRI